MVIMHLILCQISIPTQFAKNVLTMFPQGKCRNKERGYISCIESESAYTPM